MKHGRKASPEPSYTNHPFAGSSIRENMDARKMPAGYTTVAFNDQLCSHAVVIKSVHFLPLRKQEIPFQQETVISNVIING